MLICFSSPKYSHQRCSVAVANCTKIFTPFETSKDQIVIKVSDEVSIEAGFIVTIIEIGANDFRWESLVRLTVFRITCSTFLKISRYSKGGSTIPATNM